MTYRRVALFGVAMLASACADRGGPVLAPNAQSAGSQVDVVARAFALGMAVPEVRAAIRDAMRASPLTEHKLSLQQFAASPAGAQLLRAAASATGMGLDGLRVTVAELPELDFYLPVRQHRLTWRATDDYIVAVNLNGRGVTGGYGRDGRLVALDLFQPVPPSHAILMLQTAETKSRRIHPQLSGRGATIQDADDGELSGSLVIRQSSGATETIDLADLVTSNSNQRNDLRPLEQCFEDCGGGGGGGGSPPPPPPTVSLTYIHTSGIVDYNNPFETNEFEFNSTATNGTTGFLRIEGIPSSTNEARHDAVIATVPSLGPNNPYDTSNKISIDVKETDGWPNPDDHFYFSYPPLQPPPSMDPNYCGAVPLGWEINDNGRSWNMKEDSCGGTQDLTLTFGW